MAKLSTRPRFTHDCAKCRFVASVNPTDGRAFDLYEGCDGTVIARTGDDGPEYHAMSADLADHFAGKYATTLERAFFVRDLLAKLRGV